MRKTLVPQRPGERCGALIYLLSHMGAVSTIYKGGEALAVVRELDWCINLVHKILNLSRKNKK